MQDEQVDLGPHRVVVNHEDQYSILPVGHEIPTGWRDAGPRAPRLIAGSLGARMVDQKS